MPVKFKCPLSEVCDYIPRDTKESNHLKWHRNRRKPILMKIHIARGETYTSNNFLIKSSYRQAVVITVRVDPSSEHSNLFHQDDNLS